MGENGSVAISDALRLTAQAVETIERKRRKINFGRDLREDRGTDQKV